MSTETQTETQAVPRLADMDIPAPPGASPDRWRGVLRRIDELAAKNFGASEGWVGMPGDAARGIAIMIAAGVKAARQKIAEDKAKSLLPPAGPNTLTLDFDAEDYRTVLDELEFRRRVGDTHLAPGALIAAAIRELDSRREAAGRAEADQAEKDAAGIKALISVVADRLGPGIATQFGSMAQGTAVPGRAIRYLFDSIEATRAKAVAQATTAAREEARRIVQSVIEAIHGPESAVASRSITSLADLAAFAIRPNREPFTLPAATRTHLAQVSDVTTRLSRTTGMAALAPEEIRSILDASIDGTV